MSSLAATDAAVQGLTGPASTTGDPAGPGSHRHIPALDGLRALAVGMVMLAHTGLPEFFIGALGVDVFFVLSGFLITGLLYAEFRRLGRIRLGAFYWRRVLRLYPALLLLLVLVLPLHAQVGLPTVGAWAKAAAVGATYMGDFAGLIGHPDMGRLDHLWTLAIEEHFYLIWPAVLAFLLWRGVSRTWLVVLLMLLVVASSAELTWLAQPVQPFDYTAAGRLDSRSFELLGGGVIAIVLSGRRIHLPSWWPLVATVAGLGGVAALIALVWHYPLVTSYAYYSAFESIHSIEAAIATAAIIVVIALDPRALVSRLLSLAPLRYIGRISYGLYLYHNPVYAIIFPIAAGWGWRFSAQAALGVGTAFVVSVISFHLVEARFLRLKDRGRQRLMAPTADLVGGADAV